MARIFLAVIGVLYVLLAGYCAVLPEKAAKAVGFELRPGSGQSEFLTIYGGLELGLGILFLWPLFRPGEISFPLLACLVVHGCLVLFRTAGFLLYRGIPPTTYYFAASEWVIFLGAAFVFWRKG